MKRVGAACFCRLRTTHASGSWADFGKSPSLEPSGEVRSSVQFFPDDQPTESLSVGAYVVPSEAIKYDVLLGRDGWMRFQNRFYRRLAPCPTNNRVLGELTLPIPGQQGAAVFNPDPSAYPESVHLL